MSAGKMLHTGIFLRTKTKKLQETLDTAYESFRLQEDASFYLRSEGQYKLCRRSFPRKRVLESAIGKCLCREPFALAAPGFCSLGPILKSRLVLLRLLQRQQDIHCKRP